MQEANVVLSMLKQKSTTDRAFVFERLYRNLFNPDFYLLAHKNILLSIPGSQRKNEGYSETRIEDVIARLRQETYSPRPIGPANRLQKHVQQQSTKSSSYEDMLIQEILRLLLQAIYEPLFTDTSHSFRSTRNYHTALKQITSNSAGINRAIEGNIGEYFAAFNHTLLQTMLSRKISDGRLLHLIERFLKAGYLEFHRPHNSLSATLEGTVISPLLANIYLHDLDIFMEKICAQHNMQQRTESTGSANHVRYTRYADHFLVMVKGDKQLAESIQNDIGAFFIDKLQIPLNREKIPLINLTNQPARFLGYDIALPLEHQGRKSLQLLVPGDVVRDMLKPFVANEKPVHHNARINMALPELLQQYNSEIRNLYEYYSLATDVSTKIGRFRYYHYHSLLKTVARKEKSSLAKVLARYGVPVKLKQGTGTRKIFGITHETRDGMQTITYFNDPIKKSV